MNISTKFTATAAASLLGVALAGGAGYAVAGSLTAPDAPGQALQLSGVGPASVHASETAKVHANANAKGLFGDDAAVTEGVEADAATDGTGTEADTGIDGSVAADTDGDLATNSKSAQGVESSTNTAAPIAPSVASKNASTVKGSATGKSISAWAHANKDARDVDGDVAADLDADVEAVAPGAAVSIDTSLEARN